MPAIQTTDWLALKTRADTLITDPVMPRYAPGDIFTAPIDANNKPLPYILLSDATNTPDRGGRIDPSLHVRSGTLMITIMWPIARPISHASLKEIAGQVAAHFPADTCMSYGPSRLRVTQDSDPMQPYVDGAYRVAVVRVFWSSM